MIAPLRRISSALAYVAPGLMAATFARLIYGYRAAALHFPPFDPTTWVRGDSHRYLSIAVRGYDLFPCDARGEPHHVLRNLPMCGTTAWFPGLSWAMRPFVRLGAPPAAVGLAIGFAFHVATLSLLWNVFLEKLPVRARVVPLAIGALFFGSIYYHALFPVSMCTFFGLLTITAIERKARGTAAVSAMATAASYSTGFLVSGAIAAQQLFARDGRSIVSRARRALLPLVGALLGTLAVFFVMARTVGRWDAFFVAQKRFGNHLSNPLENFQYALSPLFGEGQGNRWVSAQTGLVGLLVVVTAVLVLTRRRERPSTDVGLLVWVLAFWLFPFMMGRFVSRYRSESLLIPLVVLIARYHPWWLQVVVLALAATFSWVHCGLFFEYVLN